MPSRHYSCERVANLYYYYAFYKIRNAFNVSQCENYSPQKKYRSHCYSLLCSIHLRTTSEYLNKCMNTKLNKEAIFGFMQSCSCLSCRISYCTWCHVHVVCMSSARHPRVIYACAYVVRTRTCHPRIVCRPSAPLLMVTVGLNLLL